ncbi:MAG: helix-turn-helix transcriptional regulator [Sphingomonadales bacterium]|nr:helix-turn-helix transcriptional regulator [Sphingomonadales bacterium]
MSSRKDQSDLTEYECHLLAMIGDEQPTTAYRLRKRIAELPSAGMSSSPGAIYPIVTRLKAKGYVTAAPIEADGRNTELLLVTKDGRGAIRRWIKAITPEQLLPDDPLRTRASFAQFLGAGERGAWLHRVKAALEDKLAELEEAGEQDDADRPLPTLRQAVMVTRARLAWVTGLIAEEGAEPLREVERDTAD